MPYFLHDSPRYAALVPGLRFVHDLGLEHHGLPRSYFFSQQVAHRRGELWLCLDDLRGLLLHHKRAKREEWVRPWSSICFRWITRLYVNFACVSEAVYYYCVRTFESGLAKVARVSPGALGLVPQSASVPASASRSLRAAAHTCWRKRKSAQRLREWSEYLTVTQITWFHCYPPMFDVWPDETISWYLEWNSCSKVMTWHPHSCWVNKLISLSSWHLLLCRLRLPHHCERTWKTKTYKLGQMLHPC